LNKFAWSIFLLTIRVYIHKYFVAFGKSLLTLRVYNYKILAG